MEGNESRSRFRVYSWDALGAAVLMLSGLIYELYHLSGAWQLFLLSLPASFTILYFYYALTKEGHEEYIKEVEKNKESAKNRSYRFQAERLVPIVLIFLGWMISRVFPPLRWLVGLLFLIAMIMILRRNSYRKEKTVEVEEDSL